ncbi:MAG: MFS transporter [Chloroflexi bacterium]|nr:MFS transporter [Chloroflexota bacterium]
MDAPDGSPTVPPGGVARRAVRSLGFPPFRYFWASNFIVAMGLMVQFTARAWLVVQLTDSALVLGAVEASWAVTFALGSIPMGLVADRFNRRTLLLIDNVVAVLVALTLGVLVVTDLVAVWHVFAASLAAGLLGAVRFPASQAMTGRLVPEHLFMNATSLNTASHSVPSVVGPALGGLLVGGVGVGVVYFATSGAHLAAAVMLFVGVAASFGSIERDDARSVTADLRDAIAYLRADAHLLRLTAVIVMPFVLGSSYTLLLALFVEKELGGGAAMFGFLSASLGAGGVIGAMVIAAAGQSRQIGYLMFLGIFGVGAAALTYGFSHWLPLTALALMVGGAAQSALFVAYETFLLLRVPDEMRGRIMGLTFTIFALFPVGAIFAGALADLVGLRAVAILEGVVVLVLALFAWRFALRHVAGAADAEVPGHPEAI